MRRAAVLVAVVAVLAGCSQDKAGPQPQDSATIPVSPAPTSASPVAPPTSQAPTSASPEATKSEKAPAGADAFCAYLEQAQGAQQQIEDPAAFVELVEGAAAVAPGAIAEDAALYVESVRALATTVTGSAKQAAKADEWLTRNEDAIATAQENLDSYSQSTCGLPFITGEG